MIKNDVYILITRNITIVGDNGTQVGLKNCAPFIKCIAKLDGTTLDDPKDLDSVMPMSNLIE